MKRILYFFPLNPITKNAGCKIRSLRLLEYFKKRNLHVDFVGLEYWDDDWTEDGIKTFKNSGLVENLILFPSPPQKLKRSFIARILKKEFAEDAFEKQITDEEALPNLTTYHIKQLFEALLKKNKYDSIIISYAYWAHLIYNSPNINGAKTIIDTHDLLSSQLQNDNKIVIGKSLEEELKRLAFFDEVWAISSDELFFFGQFVKSKVSLVSMSFNSPELGSKEEEIKEYDLIYVGSNNENNIKSIKWFFDNVYSKLNKKLRICIVGNITDHIDEWESMQIIKIPYAENLDSFYRKSKVALCPMVAGTGIKVKVVEALSYGLPVVCTPRGTDGLPNKINNGCIVCNDANTFISNIHRLTEDSDFYREQSRLAREMFDLAFDSKVSDSALDKSLNLTNNC